MLIRREEDRGGRRVENNRLQAETKVYMILLTCPVNPTAEMYSTIRAIPNEIYSQSSFFIYSTGSTVNIR